MTKIKLKILLTCLCSVALIFCVLLIVVNVAIPKSLERQAKNAIKNEYTEYVPDENDTKGGNFLSASVGYLEISQRKEDLIYLTETEKAIIAYCAEKNVVNGKFYRIKDKNRDVILATYSSDYDATDKFQYALYVDISAVLSYVKWLNLTFGGVVLIVGAVICVIGFKLGKTIETAQEIRQSFFQNASHELKTPLMAIQGYAEGIQTGVLPAKESAVVILEESDRMTALIEELLALSKIDSAQAKLNFQETDMVALINSIACSFYPTFENAQKKLKVTTCSSAGVTCDERQMRKAVSNLISNAFKFSKTTVSVDCISDNEKIRIMIADDGDGISDEDVSHIFERFYTGKNGNTGIGLALAKEIVKLHGGDIKAYNHNCAVFEITLPTPKKNNAKTN